MWMRNVKSYSGTIPLIQGSVGLGTGTHSVISEPGGRLSSKPALLYQVGGHHKLHETCLPKPKRPSDCTQHNQRSK